MKIDAFMLRFAAIAFAIGLQSCGISQVPPVANGAAIVPSSVREQLFPHHTRTDVVKGSRCAQGELPPAALRKKPLVYVASYLCVLIYRPGLQAPVGEIKDGISMPTGLFLDGSGNLYVANGNNASSGTTPSNTTVAMYEPGKLKPSRVYSGLALPESVAVTTGGTVYIADALGSPSGTGIVREYNGTSTTPSASLSVSGAYAAGLALDSSDNLYVAWWTAQTSQIVIYKYAAGSTTGTNLNLDLPTDAVFAHSLAFDHSGNLVIPVETGYLKPNQPQYLEVFPPGSRTGHKIWLGSLANLVYGVAIPHNDAHLMYVTGENSNNLLLLTYPRAQVRAASTIAGAGSIVLSGF